MARTATLGCALVLAGCGSGAESPRVVVRDSAGVRIVETPVPVWGEGERWTVEPVPSLEIGVVEGEPAHEFSRVAGAIRLSDGTIVVADGATNEVRFFNGEGVHVRSVGGSGQGPGEFEYIRALMSCGTDSIFAFDLHWQVKVYGPGGELVRERRLQEPGSLRSPYALSCSRAGQFVIMGWGAQTFQARIGFYRATSPVYVLDAAGEPLLHLGEFTSSERIGTATGSRPHPFGRSTTVALGPDEVFVGTGEALEVRTYALDGSPRRILRSPPRDLTIRREHVEQYRRDQVSRLPEERRPAAERELRDMPLPERFPAYSELRLDPDGYLWVRLFLRPGETEPGWGVFSPEGAYLGEVDMPRDVTVVEVGPDYILGVHRDDLQVERVRLYRVVKVGAP